MATSEADTAQPSQVQTDHGNVGKYTILMELGSGGSATVSAAISKGIAGFSKIVVLKAIRDGLGHDEATVKMFLGEARLSARMNHPNVVQVYEVFKQNNLPVIVMEYLDGQSLATLLARCSGSSDFPVEIGIAILAKTLAGLQYAHSLTDYSGEPLHLVHRDVSPHNVMIGYDGQVKLVDFGIAKLKNQNGQTRTGVIKGKLNYMAPEQVHGDMDHRADIFAVGVMLWEVVARQRYWGDSGDATIIGRLLTGNIPQLRDAKPDADPELERICLKALAVDPDKRYARAADMQSDLEAYLKGSTVDVTQEVIGALLDRTCRDLREKTRAALQAKMSAVSVSGEFDLSEGNDTVRSAVVSARPKDHRPIWVGGAAALAILLGAAFLASQRTAETPAATTAPRVAPEVLAAAPAPMAAAPAPSSAAPAPPERVRINIVVLPQEAQLYIDDRRLSSNPFRDSLPRDGAEHTFRAEADGYELFTKSIRLESDVDITISMKAEKAAPKAPPSRYRARPAVAGAPKPAAAPEAVVAAAPPPAEPAPRAKAAAPGEDLRGTVSAERVRREVRFEDPYANP
jgi:serine/threonine-protein kinase